MSRAVGRVSERIATTRALLALRPEREAEVAVKTAREKLELVKLGSISEQELVNPIRKRKDPGVENEKRRLNNEAVKKWVCHSPR